MQRYLMILEPTETGYSAYAPDLPGCIAAASSQVEAEEAMREAIALHVEGLRESGLPIPPGSTAAAYAEVAA